MTTMDLMIKYEGKCALRYDSGMGTNVELFYLDDHWRVWTGDDDDGNEVYAGDSFDTALQTFHNEVLKLEQGE